MKNIIKLFNKSQQNYTENMDRNYLKENSQFFTPIDIANKMVSTINLSHFDNLKEINLLEPSAGCGVLILAIVESLITNCNIQTINIDAYELDKVICGILRENLRILKDYVESNHKVFLKYRIYNSNFITNYSNRWNKNTKGKQYDVIISNPPYKKVNQDSKEAIIMKDIVHGQPNIYTLFIGMSLKLLKKNGTFVVISPRNYLSGEYSKKLRNFIFYNYSLTHIHSFDDRYIFKPVNQEVIISTYESNLNKNTIQISHNGSFSLETNLNDLIYDKKIFSLLIPKCKSDLELLSSFSKLKCNLSDLNIKVSVGPVVQFRNVNYLSKDIYEGDFAPLLIGNDIQNDNFINYINRENIRKTHNKAINILSRNLIKNSNYLILRKVTAKDDKNLLVSAVLNKDWLKHELLGLDNNLLYFHRLDKSESLSLDECYGLYCYINSKQFKQFYSLINGTHTINVSDFNKTPFPAIDELIEMGKEIMNSKDFSELNCSSVFENIIK